MTVQPGAAFVAPPPYIADHDTAPQQVVKNDDTSILIRTLQNKAAKQEAKRKQAKAAGGRQPLPGQRVHGQLLSSGTSDSLLAR